MLFNVFSGIKPNVIIGTAIVLLVIAIFIIWNTVTTEVSNRLNVFKRNKNPLGPAVTDDKIANLANPTSIVADIADVVHENPNGIVNVEIKQNIKPSQEVQQLGPIDVPYKTAIQNDRNLKIKKKR